MDAGTASITDRGRLLKLLGLAGEMLCNVSVIRFTRIGRLTPSEA
jgi:hypothetical protein